MERNAVEKITHSLSLSEKILLLRRLQSTTVVLEYGDGDTIPIYCQMPLKTVIIISSNPSIQQVDATACMDKQIPFLPYYVTLGELGQYNSYITNASFDLWSNYVKSFEFFQFFQPNLYFIHEKKLRFAILLRLLLTLLDNNDGRIPNNEIESRLLRTTVIIHDYYYHSYPIQMFLLYYDLIDCIDSIIILKPKLLQYLNEKLILEDYNKYVKIYL